MSFWRRLRLYLVGVGFGLIMVWIFFGRGERPSWTPEGRVLLAIDSSNQYFSERAICQMNCLSLDSASVMELQRTASVNFSESNTQQKPCPVYQINGMQDDLNYQLIWKVCENDEKVFLVSIRAEEVNCSCE